MLNEETNIEKNEAGPFDPTFSTHTRHTFFFQHIAPIRASYQLSIGHHDHCYLFGAAPRPNSKQFHSYPEYFSNIKFNSLFSLPLSVLYLAPAIWLTSNNTTAIGKMLDLYSSQGVTLFWVGNKYVLICHVTPCYA